MSEWLDKVPTFWKNSSLLYVRIYIGEAGFLSRMDIPASLREDTAAAITFVRQTTSERLLTCTPSVRLIAVKLIDETSWWRVQRNGDGEPGRRLVPISRDVGHHVEAYLYSEEFEQTLVLDESRFDHR
ncbi:hypothetical protein EVJ58_g2754 [Rhodofomes roseus]|uniref:Uncharacterized protein n=1 Tax=Rhodofomes roseus TaxID=34475 RepID=A0A4Y9YSZ5_9APHY|nr:hypothetical protein EVJ58_g2754 [Rhodofomes roseus]